MKIVKFQAENFKKLKAIEIIPQDRVVELTGKCEAGKTSVLDAIMTALCGTKWDEPIRQGADKGKIVIDLEDIIVTRTLTKSGGTLKVETREGARYPSPQTLLDKLVGKLAFNPLEFARADSKKQVDMLLKVVDLKVDAVRLKDISGVEVKETPNPLDMLNTAYKSVFEDRTVTNRQLDAAKKTLDSMAEVPETKAVSVTELVAEKDRLQGIIAANNDVLKRRDMAKADIEEVAINLAQKADFIKKLEQQLSQARKEYVELEKEQLGANKVYEEWNVKASHLTYPDLTDINTRIAQADETNLQAKLYQKHQEKQAEVDKLQADTDGLTAKLEAIKNYKTEIIQNTKFPVPGLDFANGGVIYNGYPFSQASGAQKIRVGMGVGMAANPELRVVMIDGYESLDSDQRRIVEEMAAKHDFQVWTTTVSNDGKVGIYIEDGEIKNAD